MLRQLSTPQTSGQISGLGLGMGYFGSVVLLLVVYFGFISGDGDHAGLLNPPVADGQNVRAAMLFTRRLVRVVRAAVAHRACPARSRIPWRPRETAVASSAGIASCGTRSAANGGAITTSSTT